MNVTLVFLHMNNYSLLIKQDIQKYSEVQDLNDSPMRTLKLLVMFKFTFALTDLFLPTATNMCGYNGKSITL